LQNQKSFTSVEIIAVLIILNILATVTIPSFIDLEENAKQRAIDSAILELNGQENLVWVKLKFSATGYENDAQLMLD